MSEYNMRFIVFTWSGFSIRLFQRTMGQNMSKRKELVKLLDQAASDPRLKEKLQLILDVKSAPSFKHFPLKSMSTTEKDIALALIHQVSMQIYKY